MKTNSFLQLIIFIFFSNFGLSQSFDPSNFNQKYLEHQLKIRIDSVRESKNLKPLVNDSILYFASLHHSNYMLKNNILTHDEKGNKLYTTPQNRALAYGASKNYLVGENVLFVSYNANVKMKSGQIRSTYTYEDIARTMTQMWVESKGHYKNILTESYQVTGVSVSLDEKNGKIYACQKFAQVLFKSEFTENKSFFTYSEYVPPPKITAFEEKLPIDPEIKHPFKLRQDDSSECVACKPIFQNEPLATLRLVNNTFVLRIENSEYVKDFIRNRKDGFAVELVSYDDYVCGNNAYYTKNSRRKGNSKLNGIILEPVYRKDLLKGFKKRKLDTTIRFVSYIFRKDSIPFFKRFGQYKIDRYNSQYFEIRLGKVPKNAPYFYNHNLVSIKNKQICHIDYFTNYEGKLDSDSVLAEYLPPTSKFSYVVPDEIKTFKITIPFEQGQVEFKEQDVFRHLKDFQDLFIEINQVDVLAFASVEGDSIKNKEIQEKRARNILKTIEQQQKHSINHQIRTETDWKSFDSLVLSNPKYTSWKNLSRAELAKTLSKSTDPFVLNILNKQRRGEISIRATIPLNEQNLVYLLKLEWHKLLIKNKDQSYTYNPEKLEQFYRHLFYLLTTKKIDFKTFQYFKIPIAILDDSHKLKGLFLQYEEYFQPTNANYQNELIKLVKECQDLTHINDTILYENARLQVNRLIQSKKTTEKQFKSMQYDLNELKSAYNLSPPIEQGIDKMDYSIHYFLLNYFYKKDSIANSGAAIFSLNQVYLYLEKYNLLDTNQILKLADIYVYYSGISEAYMCLKPYEANKKVLMRMLPLMYNHSSFLSDQYELDFEQEFIDKLKDAREKLNDEEWCNLFINENMIPFQVFDNKEIRDLFCESCQAKNHFLNGIEDKK